MTVRLYEGDKTEVGGAGIEITDNKVVNLKLREENNLIEINEDDEAYVDLQLEDGIAPDDDFPVGVTTGRVLVADGRPVAGTVTISKTTSGDYTIYLYGDDGKVYVDNGTGTWKILGRPQFVTQAEYNALPQSKESDNNLYIVVDHHASFELIPWPELRQELPQPDAQLEELNKHPQEYLDYYLSTGDVEDIHSGGGEFRYWETRTTPSIAKFDPTTQTAQEIEDIIENTSGWEWLPPERAASLIAEAQQGLWVECYPD